MMNDEKGMYGFLTPDSCLLTPLFFTLRERWFAQRKQIDTQ
jgi:hypothetical protein